jgi:hypothetical protein
MLEGEPSSGIGGCPLRGRKPRPLTIAAPDRPILPAVARARHQAWFPSQRWRLAQALHVCHFPPGVSTWNKLAHRLFRYVTQNWRGRPLVSLQAIVSLIAATTTKAGLLVHAALDTNTHETQIQVSDKELAPVKLTPADFHGEWNHRIAPRK